MYIIKKIHIISAVFIAVSAAAVLFVVVFRVGNAVTNDRRELLRVWNEGNFELAHEISKNFLIDNPVDYFFLTVNGFAAYQMGISQVNQQNMLAYINESIFSLRKALLHNRSDGRVYYVLGKAYSLKGPEFADLVVRYLTKAKTLYHNAVDIPEFLGLAFAAFGDYRRSVEAFSQAFVPGQIPSDNLLLPIARSYMAMQEYNMAIKYLRLCIEHSPDSRSVVIARFMLAEIYKSLRDFTSAERQFRSIINEAGENAEIRFQLGELYNLMGDSTRARFEWRAALRLNPAHAGARARLI